MPLAGDSHVQVPRDRRCAPAGRSCAATSAASSAGWAACDSLPPKPPPIRVQMQTTWFCCKPRQWATDGLDLARVLGRGVDRDLAALAGDRQGRLGLQVEMLLAAGAEGPLEDVLGLRECGLGVAPRQSAASGR